MSTPGRRNTLRGRWWQHCSHFLTHGRTLNVFALEAVQDGVKPCHSECRTALYHQISGERDSETGWKSPQVCSQYGEEILSCKSVYDWWNKFPEDREQVANRQHAHVQPTAVTDVNIRRVEELILESRRIAVPNIASKVRASAGSVETIIHEHLLFKKVCARWVPKIMTLDQKAQHDPVSAEHLNLFEPEENAFLQRVVTCNETWVHHFTPESKRSRMEWCHKGSPPPKISKHSLQLARSCQVSFGFRKGDSSRFSATSCNS
jgi:histone-lysine N-methyltransferase SETMAR